MTGYQQLEKRQTDRQSFKGDSEKLTFVLGKQGDMASYIQVNTVSSFRRGPAGQLT